MLDQLFPIAVRKEPKVSDLEESAGEYMPEEAADELHRLQGHLFDLIVVLRVSPAVVDLPAFEVSQPAVGDCYSVSVSRQIA